MKKKNFKSWTKEEEKKVAKYCNSKAGKKELAIIMQLPNDITHTHSYPSNNPCCIEWWNSIKDIPFTI